MKTDRVHSPGYRCDSLGSIPPGTDQRYLITRILFDEVRRTCARMGIEEGTDLLCRDRSDGIVYVEVSGGALCDLDLAHAWFVAVEPTPSGRAVA